ncbi:Glycoside hydrolase family 71 [Penicillium cf. griseofulvum]|uniref:Glycoside hydrolase family 71 n=1 Tax=Penicillium cf. griseofulvum TaxID=2972120 RepID=A0A9W9IY14_9EURO|nr:Glycoside hydrolase family 71 [Penicillium cf. griseofulvum]KAJ5430285.1 Glycoside hydrolase family 71 [Penicillium cf. griseofulvum]KAJ5435945.1 Glycoside hydrolase family 71 [Penicillium cf. griseofulvum]
MGIVSNRQSASDYDNDMKRARDAGIDAFALNIGTDHYNNIQLGYAYESAANNDMKVFISFDFNWWHISQGSEVGAKIAQYAGHPAQLMVDGKVFVSSFIGDGVDVGAIRSAAGREIFFAPNFQPGKGDFKNIDGAFNWMGWDSDGNNKAPSGGHDVCVADGDKVYEDALQGKAYIAPISPWFSTHYGEEVSYPKNWVFPSDLLWYERWKEILRLSPRFVEIITWNDYGESHYIGPLSSPHTDDGASKWAMDMPHNGWLDMAKPFIAAFKAESKLPIRFIEEEKLVYWYRPTLKSVDCDATDTTMQGSANNASGNFFHGRPNGFDTMKDEVFIVTMLKFPATVQVKSGNNTETFIAPPGVWSHSVPMGVGPQSFKVTRAFRTVQALSGTSLRDVVDTCACPIYNFNAYVGTLPAEPGVDRLQPDGLTMLSKGLKVPPPINTLGL